MSPSPYLWEASTAKTMAVSPDSVWALWDRPARWADWNPSIKATEFVGPFTEGATVLVRLHRRPSLRLLIVALERRRGFCHEARLPGARLGHEHRIWPDHAGKIEVSHKVYFAGPLARLWGTIIGPRLRRDLDHCVANEERLAWEIEVA